MLVKEDRAQGLLRIEATFAGYLADAQARATRRIIFPLTPDEHWLLVVDTFCGVRAHSWVNSWLTPGDLPPELTGRFVPVTDATYWSDSIGEARATAAMVAINHQRAQILAPHREVDPWAGLDRSGEGASGGLAAADPGTAPAVDPAWPEADRPNP